MKKLSILLGIFFLLLQIQVHGQVAINEDGSNPDASAILDLKSSDKGFLLPRMSTTEINAIANPAEGLVVYNTDSHLPVFYNGTSWLFYDGSEMIALGAYYEGGAIYYFFQSGDPGYVEGELHGLICSITDLHTSMQWYNGSYVLTGASGTTIGTGQSNTDVIINVQGDGSYAAKLCSNYDDGNWYLPSLDEAHMIQQRKSVIDGTASIHGGTALAGWPYWCSSETNTNQAKYVMAAGFEENDTKSMGYYVRAVRTF